MSQPVEIVRRMYEARDGADIEGRLACFHPDVVLDASVRPDGAVVQGRDELARTLRAWVGAFDDWREEVHEMRDLGSQVLVVATQRGRAKASGIDIDTRHAVLYETRGGQITRMTLFREPADALAAAGVVE